MQCAGIAVMDLLDIKQHKIVKSRRGISVKILNDVICPGNWSDTASIWAELTQWPMGDVASINPSHKSHNASDRCPAMHHFVTEMRTFLLQNGTLWNMGQVYYAICELGQMPMYNVSLLMLWIDVLNKFHLRLTPGQWMPKDSIDYIFTLGFVSVGLWMTRLSQTTNHHLTKCRLNSNMSLQSTWTVIWHNVFVSVSTARVDSWSVLENHLMTSTNGNIFHVTGPLWGESSGRRWIPLTKAIDAELLCFLWSMAEQTVERTIKTPLSSDGIALIMTPLQHSNTLRSEESGVILQTPLNKFLGMNSVFLAATKQAAVWMVQSARWPVWLSVRLSHLFHHVPIIVSSWNFLELLIMTEVVSIQNVKVRGQRSRW